MKRNSKAIAQIIIVILIIVSFMSESVSAQNLNGLIIESADSTWTKEEIALVNEVWANTSKALEEAGFDSQEILSGYRFRRQQGEYVDGVEGRIAIVRHNEKEIVLGDAAFTRLKGFYIYHELGHVVDKAMGRETNRRFHEIAGSPAGSHQAQTADGFWLNDHAHESQYEATADAFALWVIIYYTDNYRPVFAGTPVTIDYESIVETFDAAISQ